MFLLKTALALLAATHSLGRVAAHAGHDDAPADDGPTDVVVLTDDTYEAFVKDTPLSLVEYYAPWCGHCQRLKPEYDAAATELKSLPVPVPIAKIDCTVETKACEKEGIRGFPTLKVWRNGVSSDYKGQRTADSIVQVMKRNLLPAITDLTAATVKDFAASSRVVVVGFFDEEAKEDREIFARVASALREDFVFGSVPAASTTIDNKTFKSPSVALFKQFDDGLSVFNGPFTYSDITAFINDASVPIMDDISGENYQLYMQRGLPIAFFFHGTPEQKAEHGKDFEAVAKEFVGKVSFVYLDATKFGGHAGNLALKEQWPAFGIQHILTKYPFDQTKPLTREAIREFTAGVVGGTIEPTLKSEPIPETQEGPVTVVVGKSFDNVVRDTDKDVLIEFYAPWCGHCKKLAPVWDELATSVKSDKIVIAKMDATANDVPPATKIDIQGFPTIALVTAGDNRVIMYEGDRTLDSFLAFLKSNAVNASDIDDANADSEPEAERDEL